MPERDDFTEQTKRALASRVAWRCSRPDCRRLTIGPKQGEPRGFMTAGEAAHITAAARNGPRYDERLSPEQRSDFSNGLWLCSVCADVIDKDHLNYSAATLAQWRTLAERATHEEFAGAAAEAWLDPTTFVGFGTEIVAEAVWLGGRPDEWVFGVRRMVVGDEPELIKFLSNQAIAEPRFVTVESQGDGRLIRGAPAWARRAEKGFNLVVTLPIEPRTERFDPRATGLDFALVNGDLALGPDGDFVTVTGTEAAAQSVWLVLSTPLGGWVLHPELGSRWHSLAKAHQENLGLLGRLLLLDMARLVNVPVADRIVGVTNPAQGGVVQLDSIERVEVVRVERLAADCSEIVVKMAWKWAATGERWEGEIKVPLFAADSGPMSPAITNIDP